MDTSIRPVYKVFPLEALVNVYSGTGTGVKCSYKVRQVRS